MSLNKVMLIGRLDDKPRIQETEGGGNSVGLSVVTTMRHWLDVETGEEREGREWHRVVVVEPRLAAFAGAHLREHDQVYVEGQLQTECWQDETFQWRSLTRIMLAQNGDQLRRLNAPQEPAPLPFHEESRFDRGFERISRQGGFGHG